MTIEAITIEVTKKQRAFIKSGVFETLYGGAAGGGKSFAQIIDAMIFAIKYPKSKQLILRRTYPELKRSLIMTSKELYPAKIASYTDTNHKWSFVNGSIVEFGHLNRESDVTRYQSAEYDVVRFDELTHFTEYQFLYMLSRIRGTNGYPKQVKSTTNPGGVGHLWVKERYLDTVRQDRTFIPAKVYDNPFLMKNDTEYIERLKQLPEKEQRALLNGDWDIFDGQFYSEFDREIHTCEPFEIPLYWKRYMAIDYGLDMLAALWVAQDTQGRYYIYRELCRPGLIISDAAKELSQCELRESIYRRFAPTDLFSRRQETGKSVIDIFVEHGLYFERADTNRAAGHLAVKELLKPVIGQDGKKTARLIIFKNCYELIKCLPALKYDPKNPTDTQTTPHEITHAPDALRYFASMAESLPKKTGECESASDELIDFLNYGI